MRQFTKNQHKPNYIYFLENEGRIKIGVSKNVRARVAEISKHMVRAPKLLGTIAGTYQQEQAIHEHLKAYRVSGEWFIADRAVTDLVGLLIVHGFAATGLKAKERQVKEFTPSPPDPNGVPRILRMIWPDDALAELQALTGASEQTCRDWMADWSSVPLLIGLAIASVVVQWIGGVEMSFQKKDAMSGVRNA